MTRSEKLVRQGFDAHSRGLNLADNPFRNLGKRFEIKSIWWEKGWKQAHDKEMKRLMKIGIPHGEHGLIWPK